MSAAHASSPSAPSDQDQSQQSVEQESENDDTTSVSLGLSSEEEYQSESDDEGQAYHVPVTRGEAVKAKGVSKYALSITPTQKKAPQVQQRWKTV